MKQKDYELCLEEKKFINYIKKYYCGIRVNFINNEIKRNKELQNLNEEIHHIDDNILKNNWLEQIENRDIYQILISLPEVQREVVTKVIFENVPLSEVAQKVGISKQLAYAYKKKFISKATELLKV